MKAKEKSKSVFYMNISTMLGPSGNDAKYT